MAALKNGQSNGSANHVDNVMEMHEKVGESDVMYREVPNRRKRGCLPVLFERSKMGPLNPRFDSSVLEDELVSAFFPQDKRKFRSALIYVVISCVAWIIFFGTSHSSASNLLGHMVSSGALILVAILHFVLTFYPIYSNHYYVFSTIFSVILIIFSLLRYVNFSNIEANLMSPVGSFCGLVEIILLLYTFIPLPLYLAVGLSLVYSVIYEALFVITTTAPSPGFVVGKILLHLCIHIVCMSLYVMSSVRKHSTFWRIGQSMMARKELREEKKLKEDIIYR